MQDKVYLSDIDHKRFEWIKLFFEKRDGRLYHDKEVISLIIDEFEKFNGINYNPTKQQIKELKTMMINDKK